MTQRPERNAALAVCIWLLAVSATFAAETLTIASHNIHYMMPNRDDDDWVERRQAVVEVIADIQPDVMAFQEMETFVGGHFSSENIQLNWVLANFPALTAGAVGEPEEFPVTQPILYNAQKLELITQGFFFFSDTPDEIYSRQWDGRYPYFATWVKLKTRTDNSAFYVFNMHNDYASRSNRLKTTDLMIERIQAINRENLPVVVVGDFNALRSFKEVKRFRQIQIEALKPGGSTNRIWGLKLLPAIDHILINAGFQSEADVTVWNKKYAGEYPSDHFPISAELTFTDSQDP